MIIFTLAMLLVNILTGYFAGGIAHKSRVISTTERLEIIINFLDSPFTHIKETNPEKD
jgi:hypothetical protein